MVFAKLEQCYHLTSTDADAVAVILLLSFHSKIHIPKGVQWLGGRVLDSKLRGRGFKPHQRRCVVVLEQDTFILA